MPKVLLRETAAGNEYARFRVTNPYKKFLMLALDFTVAATEGFLLVPPSISFFFSFVYFW